MDSSTALDNSDSIIRWQAITKTNRQEGESFERKRGFMHVSV
ncbi:hypothetical protein Hanom_Chr11g01057151 [Helianthus anomalus]